MARAQKQSPTLNLFPPTAWDPCSCSLTWPAPHAKFGYVRNPSAKIPGNACDLLRYHLHLLQGERSGPDVIRTTP